MISVSTHRVSLPEAAANTTPIAGNDTAEGRQLNRRTQIIITPNLDQFLDLIDKAPDDTGSAAVTVK